MAIPAAEPVDEKLACLERSLRGYDRLLVAYSGGVDSAYLAWEAHRALGDRMQAVIADSASLPRAELAAATAFAAEHGIPLRVLPTGELARDDYARNDAARCYFCKDELFRAMQAIAKEFGDAPVAYGMNADERGDVFRPGQKAAARHRAAAPLADAGLTKDDVRELARRAGLRVWNKPASACLASRIEPGRPVTEQALRQVEEAEEHLRRMGFRQVRVRHHGDLARVEIDADELAKALSIDTLAEISRGARAAGFAYATLDCDGYRSGSMNKMVPLASLLPASASAPVEAAPTAAMEGAP